MAKLPSLLLILQLLHPEPVVPDPSRFIQIESCPIVLHISTQNRHVSYENQSKGTVSMLRLGCVENAARIVGEEFEPVFLSPSLTTGKAILMLAADLNPKAERCAVARSKLSVVEVRFADGATWKANRKQRKN